MRRLATVTIVAAVVAGELLLGQARAGGAAFTISIDHGAWEKWGFQYPATYVFDLPDVPATVEAQRRDGGSDTWTSLPKRTADDFFNGAECVRFDAARRKAYVSVGFRTSDTIELKFAGVASAKFDSVARYYGVAGLNTKCYDAMLERREPKGRYFAHDVAKLNEAFDKTCQAGGIFYALWHPDRFRNSVLYDPRPGIEGVQGSTLDATPYPCGPSQGRVVRSQRMAVFVPLRG